MPGGGGAGGGRARARAGGADGPPPPPLVLSLVLDRLPPASLAVARAVSREWLKEASRGHRWARHLTAAQWGTAGGSQATARPTCPMQLFADRMSDPLAQFNLAARRWHLLREGNLMLCLEVLLPERAGGGGLFPEPQDALAFWFGPTVGPTVYRQSLEAHFAVGDLQRRLWHAVAKAEAAGRPFRLRGCCQLPALLEPSNFLRFWNRSCVLGRAKHCDCGYRHSRAWLPVDCESPVEVQDDPRLNPPDRLLSRSRVRASLWNLGEAKGVPEDWGETLAEFVQHFPRCGPYPLCLMMDKFTMPPDGESNMHLSHRTGFSVWPEMGEPGDPGEVHVGAYAHFAEANIFREVGRSGRPPLPLPRAPFFAVPRAPFFADTSAEGHPEEVLIQEEVFFFFADLQLDGFSRGRIQARLEATSRGIKMGAGELPVCELPACAVYTGKNVETSSAAWKLFHTDAPGAGTGGDGDTLPTLDFCLYDAAGRLRLGRAGVELWNRTLPDDAPPSHKSFSADFYAAAEEGANNCCEGFDEIRFLVDEAAPVDLIVTAALPWRSPHGSSGT